MKTAVIPQVRVDPGLRAQLEAVLGPDETLSEFVEASVRRAVEVRQAQTDFLARGQVAWENFQRTGEALPAERVLGKLQARLDARRKQLGG
ncbi:MAG: YlcI/YnfO family protein [Pseudorhodoferax sp.]